MKIKYISPSYNRPEGVKILGYLSKVKIYVSPEDYDAYVEKNKGYESKIIKLPYGVQGKGKAHVMNYILSTEWTGGTDAIIILDDDIECVMAHKKNGKDYVKTEDDFYELCDNFTLLAKEWGCGIWGFSPNSDPLVYDELAPFRTHAYLDGGIQAIVANDGLRYDERLTVKEDVDMFLQELQRYHKALRIEKYYLKKKSFEGQGGSQEFRKEGVEKEQFILMQRKWGADIIRPNKPTSTKNDGIRAQGGAIRLNVPLSGI